MARGLDWLEQASRGKFSTDVIPETPSTPSGGLAGVIQNAAKTAFKAIGNIPLTCTFTDQGAAVYVPATGGYTYPNAVDYTSLKFLFEDFSAEEVANSGGVILTTDIKASIPTLNLTPEPQIKDLITGSDSIVLIIENIKKDSARALWTFQVRKSA